MKSKHLIHDDEIRSVTFSSCMICGSPGIKIYEGLQDRLFVTPGVWNFDQCQNKECGLIWLNPMPMEEDIHKAYDSYYTHSNRLSKTSHIRKLINFIWKHFLKLLLRLTPIYQERKDFSHVYLDGIKPGKLLDVGCGNGSRLATLTDIGWSVEGQEVDPICAEIAEKKGFKIHLGHLEKLNLPDSSYEAIIMSHVIEHVHKPTKLLMECRRLLSSNGIIISITPNTHSYGHRIFKHHWRGLEPPRHVLLYCPTSLKLLAKNAGFENPVTWTTSANAHYFALESLRIIYGRTKLNIFFKSSINIVSKLFLLLARMIYAYDKDSGEECILMLRK